MFPESQQFATLSLNNPNPILYFLSFDQAGKAILIVPAVVRSELIEFINDPASLNTPNLQYQ